MSMRARAAALMAAGALAACASVGLAPEWEVAGLVLRNQTDAPMHEVRVTVPKSGATALCDFVPARGECATTFPERRYGGDPVAVTWRHRGRDWTPAHFTVARPADGDPGRPANVLIVLGEGGALSVQVMR